MRVAGIDQLEALKALYVEMSRDCVLRWLDSAALYDLVPLFQRGKIVAGFINEAARDIDVNALHRGF